MITVMWSLTTNLFSFILQEKSISSVLKDVRKNIGISIMKRGELV